MRFAARYPDGHWHDHYTDGKPIVFGWAELAEAVARFSPSSDPALVAAAHRAADGLTTDELRGHPAARVLFQARDGRLDGAALARQCATPRRTIGLAGALGLALPEPPG